MKIGNPAAWALVSHLGACDGGIWIIEWNNIRESVTINLFNSVNWDTLSYIRQRMLTLRIEL